MAKFFVGGLAPETTEDDMRQHFEQFGELVDVAVMRDQFGVPRCFGFVQYADAVSHACRATDDHIICNKKVDVKPAVPKEQIDQGAAVRTNKIFVGGLSKASTADSVRAHFSQYGNVTEVLMKFDEMGMSRGFCFVEFDNEDSAELCTRTVPMVVDDKEVECKLARPLGDKGLGKGKGKGVFGGKGMFGFGKGGPMRTDFFGKGARPSPYGAPAMRGGYGAAGFGAPAAGFGRGAAFGGRGGFGGRGAAAPGYGAAATPYGGGYGAAPAAGYGAAAGYAAAPAYGAAGYGGASYGAAAAPSYAGYGAAYGQGY